MREEENCMMRCLMLAGAGASSVLPNPMVGAVLTHRGRIIGEGYHRRFGEPHAEVNAIASVREASLLRDATLYVNLEPCSHY
ncbi:MAG: riboflavin biosynthesis protein RibD, partial [Tannerella sp.]|nr:riboflavin biosynthesis protein RibD [Tannerella sp.]